MLAFVGSARQQGLEVEDRRRHFLDFVHQVARLPFVQFLQPLPFLYLQRLLLL